MFDQKQIVSSIMKFYKSASKEEENEFMRWSPTRKRFSSVSSASEFFIGSLLDQGQKADRAWKGGEHFVRNYYPENTIWKDIADTHFSTLKSTCTKGFEGTAFASRFNVNNFAEWLRKNAEIMNEKYDGDPRNIWNYIASKDVDIIYHRLQEFYGIGDAIAKMMQFILVRNYGVAGGEASKKMLSVKPDIHLQRVCYRLGLIDEMKAVKVADWATEAKLASPADFDAAVWVIGRDYCGESKSNCVECPLDSVCAKIK
ncbi:MAG: hypothetical protein ACK5JO_10585 [Halodesulfovibrio sp.]